MLGDLQRARMHLTSVFPRDQLGPYFDAGSPYDYNLAPEEELADPTKLAVLQGKVGEDWMKYVWINVLP